MSAERLRLAHHFRDFSQQNQAATLGMWIFLATELMVFGALFTGYAVYAHAYPEEFKAGSRRLNLTYGGVNTVILLTSSLTMALAVRSLHVDRRTLVVLFLAATALLGLAFLVVKGFEYWTDYEENLVPRLAFDPSAWEDVRPDRVELFLMLYYIMTGLHALHLIVGIGIITVLMVLAWRGWFSPVWHSPVEVGGLYWHFIDIVWVFLLPLLYLVGTRG